MLRTNMSDIYNWQIGYAQKSKILDDILRVAGDSGVRVIKVTSASNNNQQLIVELNIYAKHQKDIADFIKILNERRIYKSVYTDKVKRIIGDEKQDMQSSATDGALISASTAVQPEEQDTSDNDMDSSDTNKKADKKNAVINPISAQVDFKDNEELGRSVTGYLNSIIRVVVR